MTATGRAIGLTVNNASLRRAQLSFALIWAAEWAVMVTLGVVAFRDGGSAAVGVGHGAADAPGRAARAVRSGRR